MDLKNPGTLESFSRGKVLPSMSRPLKKFYRGEPLALGITQIFAGILEIAFGLVIDLVENHHFYDIHFKTPYWTGILYIISGSLTVAAAKNPTISLVKGALGMNVVSAVAAGFVMMISSISLAQTTPPGYHSYCEEYHNENETTQSCHELHTIPYATMYSTVAFLLTLTVIEFVFAIITAAFGCASVCRNAYSETTIVIFQNTAEVSAPPVPAP